MINDINLLEDMLKEAENHMSWVYSADIIDTINEDELLLVDKYGLEYLGYRYFIKMNIDIVTHIRGQRLKFNDYWSDNVYELPKGYVCIDSAVLKGYIRAAKEYFILEAMKTLKKNKQNTDRINKLQFK